MSKVSKVDALMRMSRYWCDTGLTLHEKVSRISEEYYSAGLTLESTAAYIGATPSELDALLSLSELEDEVLRKISEVHAPITTWMMLASANDDELEAALREMVEERKRTPTNDESIDSRLFSAMIQVSGPTQEQLLSTLPCDIILTMANRAESFKVLTPKNLKALKSFGYYRKRGKTLTNKQVSYLRSILTQLVDADVIAHECLDDDREACEHVLKLLEM